MKYVITLNGREYEVEVERGNATAVYKGEVALASSVEVAPVSAPVEQKAEETVAPSGKGEFVVSPMPGAIVSVNCSVSDVVKKGDILFILEAMKMENEIVAPFDGKITSIGITKGAKVDTGTILCAIE